MEVFLIILLWKLACIEANKICSGFVKFSLRDTENLQINMFKYDKLDSSVQINPHNHLFVIPIYDKGPYIIKPSLPENFVFEPLNYSITFDETTYDPCLNKNLNFEFKGFKISYQAYLLNEGKGPKGINIQVLQKGNVIDQIKTDNNGIFHVLQPLLPGNYIIKASHNVWQFKKSSIEITIDQNGKVLSNEKIILLGFNVKGSVKYDGGSSPDQTDIIKKANKEGNLAFYLYEILNDSNPSFFNFCGHILCGSFSKQNDLNETEFLKEYVKDLIVQKSGHANANFKFCKGCTIKDINTNMQVNFQNVPPGTYKLVALYQDKDVKFDLEPKYIDLKVVNDDVDLTRNPFKIIGFTLTGQILDSIHTNRGLENVDITLQNGLYRAKTNRDGRFVIHGAKSGQYKIALSKPHFHFQSDMVIQVTPSNPRIDVIYPEKLDVCGSIDIKSLDCDVSKFVVQFENAADPNLNVKVAAQTDGSFCAQIRPGLYGLSLSMPNHSSYDGLHYTPLPHTIKIVSEPILNVKFSRYFTTIKGEIHCLNRDCRHYYALKTDSNNIIAKFSDVLIQLSRLKPTETVLEISPLTKIMPYADTEHSKHLLESNHTKTPKINDNYIAFTFSNIPPGASYRICLKQVTDNLTCWSSPCIILEPQNSLMNKAKEDSTGVLSDYVLAKFVQHGRYIQILQSSDNNFLTKTLPHTLALEISNNNDHTSNIRTLEGNLPFCRELINNEFNKALFTKDMPIIKCQLNDASTNLCIPNQDHTWYFVIHSCTLYTFAFSNIGKPVASKYSTNAFTLNPSLLISTSSAQSKSLNIHITPSSYKLSVQINISSGAIQAIPKTIEVCLSTPSEKNLKISNNEKPFQCDKITVGKAALEDSVKDSGLITHVFSLDLNQHPRVNISLITSDYLFKKFFYLFEYGPHTDCKPQFTFETIPSITILGTVRPPTPNVEITLKKHDKTVSKMNTNAKGEYAFGPLINDKGYSIQPSLEGYIFHARPNANFVFDSRPTDFSNIVFDYDINKISKLTVQVNIKPLTAMTTKDKQIALPNTLISLSSIQDRESLSSGPKALDIVKLFNATNDMGRVTYTGLAPGKYYILPIAKEYQFEPPSQLVDIGSNDDNALAAKSDINVVFQAIKSAFTCRGIVTSINGNPLLTLSLNLPESLIALGEGENDAKQNSNSNGDTGVKLLEDSFPELRVEAIGIESVDKSNKMTKCGLLKEEGHISKASGHFEIKALIPGCSYNLTLSAFSQDLLVDSPELQRYRYQLIHTLLKSYPAHYTIHVPPNQKEDLTQFYRFRLLSPAVISSDPTSLLTASLLKANTFIHGKIAIYGSQAELDLMNAPEEEEKNRGIVVMPRPNQKLLEHFKVSLYRASSYGHDKIPIQTKQMTSRSMFFAFDPLILDLQEYVIKVESTHGLDANLYHGVPVHTTQSFKLTTAYQFVSFDLVLKPKSSNVDKFSLLGNINEEEDEFEGLDLKSSQQQKRQYPRSTNLYDGLNTAAYARSNPIKEWLIFVVFMSSLVIMIYGPERVLRFVKHGLIPAIEYVLNKSTSSFKLSPDNSRTRIPTSSSGGDSTFTVTPPNNPFFNLLSAGSSNIGTTASEFLKSGTTAFHRKTHNNNQDSSDNGFESTSTTTTTRKRGKASRKM